MRSLWRRFQGVGARAVFLVTGAAALIWFLVRVIPKPSRATYPCQRAAFPIASSFVIYLMGLLGAALAFGRARQRIRQTRYVLAAISVWVGLAVTFFTISYNGETVSGQFNQMDAPNSPMGQARGVFPGRVVWVHNPNATHWDPAWNDREDIFFWDDEHTDQQVVEEMISKAIRWLTSETEDYRAWGALFRHFNETRGKGSVGYSLGEKVVIKPNHNNQHGHGNTGNDVPITPPAVYVAILRQLIVEAGVPQECITICDSIRGISDNIYDKCSSLFPDVHYMAQRGGEGREATEIMPDMIVWSGINETTGEPIVNYPLATSHFEADYIINLARMQGHGFAGVSFCGKNWYGSFGVSPVYDSQFHSSQALHDMVRSSSPYPGYRPIVDLMGHEHLGGKTILYVVDGLWGFRMNGLGSPPGGYADPPFNGDYPSSIFVSQDAVAIDSVALDFYAAQYYHNLDQAYLHEAAEADDPPSGVFYDPEGDGTGLKSLGVHEHWNNPVDKQYSRNLGLDVGIELVSSDPSPCRGKIAGDVTGDCRVDMPDYAAMAAAWRATSGTPNWNGLCDLAPEGGNGVIDLGDMAVMVEQWLVGTEVE